MFWLIPIYLGLGAAALAPLWLSALESSHSTMGGGYDYYVRKGEMSYFPPEDMKRYQL